MRLTDRERLRWQDWSPGLDRDHLTLGQVLDTLPGASAAQMPWLIRLLENPSSRLALPGAISLARHDCIHVALGRGLRSADEGFVIGATMGAASAIRSWHLTLFRLAARYLYPGPYRFSDADLIAFDLGVGFARRCHVRDWHLQPLEEWRDLSLAELRARLGISDVLLRAVFRTEQALLPDQGTSRRLDIDVGGVDPSDLEHPPGQPSDWNRERPARKEPA
jgi:hypothetical protein